MKARLKDVAARAGVAPNTASTILNRRPNSWASKDTVARVFQAAKELSYRPSRAAVGLRLGRFQTVGLIVPDLQNPFFSQMAHLLNQTLEEQGYDLIIENCRSNLKRESRCIESIFDRQIDGAFLCLMEPDNFNEVFDSAPPSIPAVLISGITQKPLALDRIEIDYTHGTREALNHLVSLGHRRFAYLSALAPDQKPDERMTLFSMLLEERGIPLEDRQVLHSDGPQMDAAHARFLQMLESEPVARRPTGVLCVNDLCAIGVIRAAMDRGLAIPRDLSIVGVDDIPMARYLPRALTTVYSSVDAVIENGVKILMSRFGEDVARPRETIRLRTRLVIRETTGAPPAGP